MNWLNPAAFAGLLALAVPILVHLFGRRTARRTRFPSLRLLRDAHATPATRSRPSDILLLVLRCAVIVAAVLGLAQPVWSNSARARAAQVPARVIIVDTSASMQRLTSDGATALLRARALGKRLLDSAREGAVDETVRPGASIAGAASWLQARSGVRELVVISDFQAGAIVDGQLASVAPGIGIRLEKVPLPGPPSDSANQAVPGDSAAGVGLVLLAERTDATWTTVPGDTTLLVVVLAPAEDRGLVEASSAVVRAIAPRFGAPVRKVVVVFPRSPARRAIAQSASPLNAAWQGDLLMAVKGDRVLTTVAESADVAPSCESGGVAIALNADGEVVATMAGASPDGEYEAVIFACVDAGSVAGTALLASVVAAVQSAPLLHELEPVVVPDETLRGWERPPAEPGPRGTLDSSPDGRWLWVVAIVFLLAEEWLRRRVPRQPASTVTQMPHERVA